MSAPTLEVAARHLNSEEMPWAELAPGIEAKLLRFSEQTGTYVLMNRFAPGTVLPTHRHMGPVHAFTIQGRWRYREYDWVATAGSFAFEPAGATHTLMAEGDEDTVALFVIEGGLIVFDDDGNYLLYEDGETMREHIRLAMEGRGQTFPAELVLP
jgi:2,4'-dihydroxyacetophenone dioxygenase